MVKYFSILIVAFPLLLTGSNKGRANGNQYRLNLIYPVDSVINLATIEGFSLVGDTLKIISTSDFLYYPFGHYRVEKKLNERFKLMEKSIDMENGLKKRANKAPCLTEFSLNKSVIKFFYDKEKKQFELVFASIISPDIFLNHQLGVNISKTDFMNKFSTDMELPDLSKVSVIELVSGLEGVWHYYTFEKGLLKSIHIDTDYTFKKG